MAVAKFICLRRSVQTVGLELVNKQILKSNYQYSIAAFINVIEPPKKKLRSTGSLINFQIRHGQTKTYCKKSALDPELSKQVNSLKKKTLDGGVIITDIIVGNGALAKSGKTVSVYYSGKLKSSNKVFDKVIEGPGLTFQLGRKNVIEGWDIGVVGMKVGGKRIITCPPAMAYGVRGYPPVIPPNSTLVFEVELKNVE